MFHVKHTVHYQKRKKAIETEQAMQGGDTALKRKNTS